MSVLAADKIAELLPDIFIDGTYDKDCIGEASYNLRLSDTLLYFDERWHGEDEPVLDSITIKRGDIAYISTVELFKMPDNLVGLIELKFKMAIRGLVHLSGSRVDPGYGKRIIGRPDEEGQKLFLLVMNMGPEDVEIKVYSKMFIVEFHELEGTAQFEPRQDNHNFVQGWIRQKAERKTYGFLPEYTNKVNKLKEDFEAYKASQKYITWGAAIILSITILGVILSFALATILRNDDRERKETPEIEEVSQPAKHVWYIKDTFLNNDSLFVLFYSPVNPEAGEYLQIVKKIEGRSGENFTDIGVAKVVGNVNREFKAVVLDQNERCEEGYFLVKR